MTDPKMEGVERRLTEKHDDIDMADTSVARQQSTVADISGIESNITPPRQLIQMLDGSLPGALCGQKFQFTWESGEWKGLPVTGYCCEPRCIDEGECTGTRFVPHVDQWTSDVPALRQRRTMTPKEVVVAVRMFAKKAAAETGRDEDRTDSQIRAHVKLVWQKTISHIKSEGGKWRRT